MHWVARTSAAPSGCDRDIPGDTRPCPVSPHVQACHSALVQFHRIHSDLHQGEATVAQYRIIHREQQWHLVIEGQECGLLQCDDRSFLVQIACSVAAERGSAVQVFDARNELEARLYFRDGSLTIDGSYLGEIGAALP
jgi:hypothetical protein